ncbi:MAG: magnesium transporter [Parcubacteria group bacterium Gr01-1014_72]|nr:MAG: magnesium transporter [Parcubacteria group bacterium Gr01-1014_72]
MLTKHTHRSLTWVDLESPTREEIREIVESYRIHPLLAHDLTAPTFKPRVDLYDNCIYLILHFPQLRGEHGVSGDGEEVDFIIGKDFLITARHGTLTPLHHFSKVFEVTSILDKGDIGEHAGFLFFHMITRLYEALMEDLESIKRDIAAIEREVFAGREREMVIALSHASRKLLDFKRATSLHKEVFRSFETAGGTFFGSDFRYHLRAITGEYYKIADAIENNLEAVQELRETNNSLLSTRENEQIRILTTVAFITLPLSMLASLFQIDATARPLIGQYENDFWIFIGIMIVLGAGLFAVFKYKKWL